MNWVSGNVPKYVPAVEVLPTPGSPWSRIIHPLPGLGFRSLTIDHPLVLQRTFSTYQIHLNLALFSTSIPVRPLYPTRMCRDHCLDNVLVAFGKYEVLPVITFLDFMEIAQIKIDCVISAGKIL